MSTTWNAVREKLGSMNGTWTSVDPRWQRLGDHERAAAMALMEADGMKFEDARNALAAMYNRAAKDGVRLGDHVSTRHYQPTFEPAQQRRLDAILESPRYAELVEWGRRYEGGKEKDPVQGATHFLAHPKTMLALEAKEPRKYRSWRSWTGFDDASGTYQNQTVADSSHAFLAPSGKWSLGTDGPPPSAMATALKTDTPDAHFTEPAAPIAPAAPVKPAMAVASAPPDAPEAAEPGLKDYAKTMAGVIKTLGDIRARRQVTPTQTIRYAQAPTLV